MGPFIRVPFVRVNFDSHVMVISGNDNSYVPFCLFNIACVCIGPNKFVQINIIS